MAIAETTAPAKSDVRMVPLADILDDEKTQKNVWPRQELDRERVKLFTELYANDAEEVPAIILVPGKDEKGKTHYVIVDGWHRFTAKKKMRALNVPAVVRSDLTSLDAVYMEACRLSGTSTKPLTSMEKRAAVRRILKVHPEMTDRAIARMVGCSHNTVGSQRNPLRRFASQAGDFLSNSDSRPLERSAPRSVEERVCILLESPKAEEPDTTVLAALLRTDSSRRRAAIIWANALIAAIHASEPPATSVPVRTVPPS